MDWSITGDVAGRLLVAALLGAAIGLERELDDHPAGLRTLMTVAVGAALFGAVSTVGFEEFRAERAATNFQVDVTRVASQVVVGIGFLGAGLIFRRGDNVVNLTTAASLWATAAVGLAAGVGQVGLALAAAGIVVVVLVVLPVPKRWFLNRFGRQRRIVRLTPSPGVGPSALHAVFAGLSEITIDRWTVTKEDGHPVATCVLSAPGGLDLDAAIAEVAASDMVHDLREQ